MNPTLVVMEGPALHSKGQGVHQLAGLWWLVKHALWVRGIPTATPTPWDVKQFATGKRNAGKDDVLREVTKRWSEFNGGNDEADALALAGLGMAYLRPRQLLRLPVTHLAAVGQVKWPDVPLVGRPRVVGLDVSITCTGVAVVDGDGYRTWKIETKPTKLKIADMDQTTKDAYVHTRLAEILSRVQDACDYGVEVLA